MQTEIPDQAARRVAQASAAPPELTYRAILTGVALGIILTPCNVYAGLKIGWGFNMSIAAGLLALGFWRSVGRGLDRRPWGLLENNINQTATSAASAIISAGLVAPIPAFTLLTGEQLSWYLLSFWVFAISLLGVVVATSIRAQMIEREGLAFPAGVATAEMMKQLHGAAAETAQRLRLMLGSLIVAGGWKLFQHFSGLISRISPPLSFPATGAMAATGSKSVTFQNLGFALDPSLLLVGLGAIVGMRGALSMILGGFIAWGLLSPWVLAQGWIEPGAADAVWFGPLLNWVLWPGVSLLVVSTLVSLTISLWRLQARRRQDTAQQGRRVSGLSILSFAAVTALIVVAAYVVFDLAPWVSILAVAMSFVLAAVAARVAGETGITPVGALGKITQLSYGAITPGDVVANLMTANITGGAAGQCADLLNDLKAGFIIGATARLQMIAQVFGIAVGSLVGVLVYLVLIPDPQSMLLTPDWPAPAVAAWKAVADVLSAGFHTIPNGALEAMVVAGIIGAVLGALEKLLPARLARWLPSAPAMGLAFVLPFWNALSLLIGAALAWSFERYVPSWSNQKTVAVAAGLVAGESLAGVGISFSLLASE